jgi:hypothetical protein
VLFANFPIALGLMLAADSIDARCVVVVKNDSAQRVDELCVVEGQRAHALGNLEPGESTDIGLWWEPGVELTLRGKRDSQANELPIEEQLSMIRGTRAMVTVQRDGTSRVVYNNTSRFNGD